MRYNFEGMKKNFEVFNPRFKIREVPLYYCPLQGLSQLTNHTGGALPNCKLHFI